MRPPPPRPEPRPGLPSLEAHLERVRGYLDGLGLLAYAPRPSPLRSRLAGFVEARRDEVVRLWVESIGAALSIDEEYRRGLIRDMDDALVRWLAHIRDPGDVATYAVLRSHARGGFIARHPPSRFLASQLKIRAIVAELLRRDLGGDAELTDLLALLDQELWARLLHVTDFFVEAREQDLAEQSENYRRSIDSAPALILHVDADSGVVTSANLAAQRELGAERDAVGRALWELHPEAERGRVRRVFATTVERGAAAAENLRLGPARLVVDLRTVLVEIRDRRFVQAMYLDLSERRRLELQLIQSEKMAAIGQLAAGIAHEIRNPLGIILSALYDLAELIRAPEPEVEEDLRIARAEIERAQEIIDSLLEFSREGPAELGPVDLNDLVGRTLKLMGQYLRKHRIEAAVELAPHGWCRANENALRQVLLNLVTNAVQAMPAGGELRLRTEAKPGRRVALHVSDTGAGIPPERLSRIFEPFFTTKPPGEGTGLGLSVVHSVVRSVGGTIEVASEPGRGTTFSIELPASSPHASGRAPSSSASP